MSLDVNISEPDEFNCNELHTAIESLSEALKIESVSYHVDFLCGKGENFIANLFRLVIKGDRDNEIKFIVKTLINTERQELFHELHLREVYVYKVVMPEFQQILERFDKQKRLHLTECFLTCNEPGNEVIILEDLKEKGYEMDQDRFISIDYEHACLVFRKLAKFHALSFILEKENPEVFNTIKSNCKDIIFDDNFINKSKLEAYFTDSFKTSVNFVIDEKNRHVLADRVTPNLINIMKEYLQPKKYNVLCHGDFWINNILFKNEEEKPVDLIFLDFQTMRYCCPVTDIMYFTYLSTDTEFRRKYLRNLLDLYHDTLKDVLKSFDINIDKVYPKHEFDQDIIDFENFGLFSALIEFKMVTVRPEDEILIKSMEVGSDIDSVDGGLRLYAIKVNELVEEFYAKGNLDKL